MSRLQRKRRDDIEYPSGKLQITDLFDNAIKESLRISDEEYDFIAANATDDDLKILLSQSMKFTDKRKMVVTLEKYVVMYKESKK